MCKPLYFIILVLALPLLIACSEDKEQGENTVAVTESNLSAPAELVSLQRISLTPPNIRRMWEFKIEFLVKENTLVSEGDVIVRFDAENLRTDLVIRQADLDARMKEAEQKQLQNAAKLEQLVLDLAEAKKDKDIARRKVEITDVSRSEIARKKQQAEYGITTEIHRQAMQHIDQHKMAMTVNAQVQNARISKAQTRVAEITQSINKLQIRAPKSGMVVLIPDSEDKKPAIGDTVYMGNRLISLPSLDDIAVKVEFDESFTSKINLGDAVRVTLDAFPEKPFVGKISELGKAYRSKSPTNLKVVFDAWVTLDELDLNIMRPGMKATVDMLKETS